MEEVRFKQYDPREGESVEVKAMKHKTVDDKENSPLSGHVKKLSPTHQTGVVAAAAFTAFKGTSAPAA